jgi:hypothetical protein
MVVADLRSWSQESEKDLHLLAHSEVALLDALNLICPLECFTGSTREKIAMNIALRVMGTTALGKLHKQLVLGFIG